MTFGVILAAGMGLRMKSKVRKQFININNKPVLYYSIDKFLSIKKIDTIIIVLNKNDRNSDIVKQLISDYKDYIHSEHIRLILGGDERYDSVFNSLKFIAEEYGIKINDNIVIHDSARPNVDIKDISSIINMLKKYKAITLASRLSDSIKKIKTSKTDVKEVEKSVDRNDYCLIKTPQAFNLKLLYESYLKFNKSRKNKLITDDLQIIEYYSKVKTYILLSSPLNYKITTKDDLKMIQYLL